LPFLHCAIPSGCSFAFNMKVSREIAYAAELIKQGNLVAFPTETVYGLGANAFDSQAVAKIFSTKERPSFNPLIVHIADFADLERITSTNDIRVNQLAERFWPGPLTLILPKSGLIPDLVTGGLPTVGVRMPDHPIALELIRQCGTPVAAPSANKFGRISPTNTSHVQKQLGNVFILEGGDAKVGIESTIIKLTDNGFVMLRNGAITAAEIEVVVPMDKTYKEERIIAPGMIKSHYSPLKMMVLSSSEEYGQINKSAAGLISFSGKIEDDFARIIRVSERQDLVDYACNLFRAMHELEDDPNIRVIVAETVPEEGIGMAIMDRLRKAVFNWDRIRKPD
jgi:L-threonylcarbamoyladenylate synthase